MSVGTVSSQPKRTSLSEKNQQVLDQHISRDPQQLADEKQRIKDEIKRRIKALREISQKIIDADPTAQFITMDLTRYDVYERTLLRALHDADDLTCLNELKVLRAQSEQMLNGRQIIEKLEAQQEKCRRQEDELQKEIDPLVKEVSDLQTVDDNLKSEITEVESIIKELAEDLDRLETELALERVPRAENEIRLVSLSSGSEPEEELERGIAIRKAEIIKLQEEIQRIEYGRGALQQEIEKLNQKAEDLRKQKESLEAKKEAIDSVVVKIEGAIDASQNGSDVLADSIAETQDMFDRAITLRANAQKDFVEQGSYAHNPRLYQQWQTAKRENAFTAAISAIIKTERDFVNNNFASPELTKEKDDLDKKINALQKKLEDINQRIKQSPGNPGAAHARLQQAIADYHDDVQKYIEQRRGTILAESSITPAEKKAKNEALDLLAAQNSQHFANQKKALEKRDNELLAQSCAYQAQLLLLRMNPPQDANGNPIDIDTLKDSEKARYFGDPAAKLSELAAKGKGNIKIGNITLEKRQTGYGVTIGKDATQQDLVDVMTLLAANEGSVNIMGFDGEEDLFSMIMAAEAAGARWTVDECAISGFHGQRLFGNEINRRRQILANVMTRYEKYKQWHQAEVKKDVVSNALLALLNGEAKLASPGAGTSSAAIAAHTNHAGEYSIVATSGEELLAHSEFDAFAHNVREIYEITHPGLAADKTLLYFVNQYQRRGILVTEAADIKNIKGELVDGKYNGPLYQAVAALEKFQMPVSASPDLKGALRKERAKAFDIVRRAMALLPDNARDPALVRRFNQAQHAFWQETAGHDMRAETQVAIQEARLAQAVEKLKTVAHFNASASNAEEQLRDIIAQLAVIQDVRASDIQAKIVAGELPKWVEQFVRQGADAKLNELELLEKLKRANTALPDGVPAELKVVAASEYQRIRHLSQPSLFMDARIALAELQKGLSAQQLLSQDIVLSTAAASTSQLTPEFCTLIDQASHRVSGYPASEKLVRQCSAPDFVADQQQERLQFGVEKAKAHFGTKLEAETGSDLQVIVGLRDAVAQDSALLKTVRSSTNPIVTGAQNDILAAFNTDGRYKDLKDSAASPAIQKALSDLPPIDSPSNRAATEVLDQAVDRLNAIGQLEWALQQNAIGNAQAPSSWKSRLQSAAGKAAPWIVGAAGVAATIATGGLAAPFLLAGGVATGGAAASGTVSAVPVVNGIANATIGAPTQQLGSIAGSTSQVITDLSPMTQFGTAGQYGNALVEEGAVAAATHSGIKKVIGTPPQAGPCLGDPKIDATTFKAAFKAYLKGQLQVLEAHIAEIEKQKPADPKKVEALKEQYAQHVKASVASLKEDAYSNEATKQLVKDLKQDMARVNDYRGLQEFKVPEISTTAAEAARSSSPGPIR